MKVLLFGQRAQNIERLVANAGFAIVTENPDVVISFGGDGTLLSSERKYPGIPKLPIRNSQFCNKCVEHADTHLLSQLLQNKLQLKEFKKLHISVCGKDLLALNDFVVRNEQPVHAIRFQVLSDDIPGQVMIGDGIVVATPFGSTGYFKSITGESFDAGFALALNNTTAKVSPTYFDEDAGDTAGFRLVRGKATLSYDNSPDIFHIAEGTKLSFRLSDQVAKIYQPTSLRCPNCQVIRG